MLLMMLLMFKTYHFIACVADSARHLTGRKCGLRAGWPFVALGCVPGCDNAWWVQFLTPHTPSACFGHQELSSCASHGAHEHVL